MRLTELQTPALRIRLDRVRTNVQHMLALAGGDATRWRPHIKTGKVPEVYDVLLRAGVRRFKCATTREAQVLLSRREEGIDLLVAYPHRGANLERVAALAARYPNHRLSLLSEDPEHTAAAVARAPAGPTSLGIFVDLDPGYHRTGIPVADRARIEATLRAAGPAVRGLHFYDGHVLDLEPAARRTRCAELYRGLLTLADDLELGDRELITSGTPTFEQALSFSGFADRHHTISPGTVVYSDGRTEELGVTGLTRAAHVLSRVVSAPEAGRVTCDAGSKALDAAAGDPCAEVEGWPELIAQTPSEEHLPLVAATPDGPTPAPGTLLELCPRHVCPTVNLADEAVLTDGDEIVAIVPVAARGHETLAPPG